jgi:hypothetical protein
VVSEAKNALVVFHEHGHGLFCRWLRWGFRHVFVVVKCEGYWIALDGRAGLPELQVVAGADFDLIAHYRCQHGFTVLGLTAPRHRSRVPVLLATCVGATKRILGLRAFWILTPHQLYRYLKRYDAVSNAQAGVD